MAFDADDTTTDDELDDDLTPEGEEDEAEADAEGDGEESGEEKEPSVQDIAKSLGWTPKDKWRGDPRKWTTAAEYVRRGAEWRKDYNREVKELKQQLEGRQRVTEEALRRQAARYEAQLKEARREAIKAGDENAVDAIDEELRNVQIPVDEDHEAESAVTHLFQREPEVELFWQDNAWVLEDEDVTDRILRFWDTNEDPRKFDHGRAIERAEKYLQRAFPERFGKQAEPTPQQKRRDPPVYAETGQRRSHSYASQLNADERKEAQSLVKEGLFKSVEEWARTYYEGKKR